MTARVTVSQSGIDAYARSAGAEALLAKVGSQIADDARANAPRDTGGGAASIGYETGYDSDGAYVRVSWGSDHFYMFFHEVGTSKMSARPFLRPALTKHRSI